MLSPTSGKTRMLFLEKFLLALAFQRFYFLIIFPRFVNDRLLFFASSF